MRRRLPAKCRKPAERNVDFFIDEYTRAWMPRFAEAVAAESRVPFYRDAAAFLGALVG